MLQSSSLSSRLIYVILCCSFQVVVASTQHKEVLALPIASPSSSALPEHGAKAGSARASATSTEGQRGSEPYQIEVEHLGDSDMDPTATWALSLVDLGALTSVEARHAKIPPPALL